MTLSLRFEVAFESLERAHNGEVEADRDLRIAKQILKDQEQQLLLTMNFEALKATNAEKREATVRAELGTLGLLDRVVNAELALQAARGESERCRNNIEHLREQRRLLAIEKGLSVQ